MSLVSFILVLALGTASIALAAIYLSLSGWIHVPTRMSMMYRTLREKLHEKGWG